MATKCWKKESTRLPLWSNKKTGEAIVINRDWFGERVGKKEFYVWSNRGTRVSTGYKRKNQALSSAKKYMSRHDKCRV